MSEKRDAYVAKMKAKLDKWNTAVDKLQIRVNQAGSDVRVELQNHVQSLQAKRIEVGERIEGLRTASEDVWRDLRADVESVGQGNPFSYCEFPTTGCSGNNRRKTAAAGLTLSFDFIECSRPGCISRSR